MIALSRGGKRPQELCDTVVREHQRESQQRLHKNLVVRVWGWSGYFCELDEAYQNQIIGRHIYGA